MSGSLSGAVRREFAENWLTVVAAGLAIGVGMMGIGFYALGLFVTPVQEEFGWSRAAASGAATFEQLGIFLSAPIVGRLADRYGVRMIAIASYIAAPIGFVLLSRAGDSVAMWWGLWLLVSLAGCGTTPAIWARAVSAKFDAGRGLALGLMLMGSGLAAFLAPALLGPIFASSGWRSAALAMAATILVVGLPVSLLMPREKKAPAPAASAEPKVRGRFEVNRQTLTIVGIAVLLGFFVAGLIVHLVPMVVDRGMPAAEAAQVAAKIGIAVIFARVIVGYLFDRFHAPFVAALFLLSPVVAALLLAFGGPVTAAALMLGLAAGAEVDMLAYFTGRYAHLRNYGATYGVVLGMFSFGAAFGPAAFGWSVDVTGSYHFALLASAIALVVVVALIATLGAYRDPVGAEALEG
ncbi:MAG: MFS transporter [Pseudomonadota bacterium]|uniref:MFS transporter n=1 Tax=Novosphingobium sp. MBES04 TaxID=1206458 RepID=UPI00057E5451|nr:MFS transporter [Novosphingobium sp. MBES04]MED5547442.1 MFS transporter [Pseudomonadota bacterium]GAM05931.1 major facilitator superfamily transporter [Novosphingobium sp. MBES04]